MEKFSEENINLIEFSDKFKDVPRKERKLDTYVLNEETIRIERIREQLIILFNEYIEYLATPVEIQKLEDANKPNLINNFFDHCHKIKINAQKHGYQYEYAHPTEDIALSLSIKEIMHVKGLQITRDLNLHANDIIITNNDYERGLMEYTYNNVRKHR